MGKNQCANEARISVQIRQESVCESSKNYCAGKTGITVRLEQEYAHTGNVVTAQTTAFVTWLLGHIALALNLKQEKLPLIEQGIFSNQFGTIWLIGMSILSLLVTMVTPLHFYMKTSSLPISLWILIIIIVIASTFWIEAVKTFKLQKNRFYSSIS